MLCVVPDTIKRTEMLKQLTFRVRTSENRNMQYVDGYEMVKKNINVESK